MIFDKIKAICKNKGVTLTEVAARVGVARNNLYLSIKNPNVQLSTLQRVADAIGCDIADFFTDASQPDSHEAHDTTHTPASASLTCPHCGTVINVHLTAE